MRQLVELQKQYEAFQKAGAEVLVIYREESKGLAGLKIIRQKSGAKMILALDTGKKQTSKYSPSGFSNYVIDKQGVIRKAIGGTLRTRPKPADLLNAVKTLKE